MRLVIGITCRRVTGAGTASLNTAWPPPTLQRWKRPAGSLCSCRHWPSKGSGLLAAAATGFSSGGRG